MKKQVLKLIGILLLGVIIGKYFFAGESEEVSQTGQEQASEQWTCSMHPQVNQKEFGLCPICAMDLIPLEQGSDVAQNNVSFQMKEDAVALANVQTSKVKYLRAKDDIILSGKVVKDERRMSIQNAHFSGRIEELYINFTEERVTKGQKIASVYSPDLVTAQQELLEAYKTEDKGLVEATRKKVKYWKLSDTQIDRVVETKQIYPNIDIVSEFNGVVTKKMINLGSHINRGKPMLHVSDLDKLWVVFDAYEQHLGNIKVGDKITVEFDNSKSLGSVEATVSFVSPVIDHKSRVAKVRGEIDNPHGKILPQMIATGIFNGRTSEKSIVVPKTALIWTGKRSLVYVKVPDESHHIFEIRGVELGRSIGEDYIIKEGLEEGERVVTNGIFTIDAAAQLQGKRSMMNSYVVDDREFYKKVKRVYRFSRYKDKVYDLYREYLGMSELLVKGVNPEDVKKSANNLLNKSILRLSETMDEHLRMIKQELKNIISKSDIKSQRKHYAELSKHVIVLVKLIGVGQPVYLQFCPMANNDLGGYWLSDKEEILNPYFGDEMLHCGLVKEVIKK